MEYRPLVLTKGKVEELWGKISIYPQVFDDVIPRTIEAFRENLMSPANQYYEFIEDGQVIGLAAATQVRPKLDASMHLVMFDRRLRGREAIITEALQNFALRAQLRRMTVVLPEDNRTAIKLIGRLGFKLEGVMRKAHLRDGIYRDYHIFGILLEELFHCVGDGQGLHQAEGNGVSVRSGVRPGDNELRPERLREDDAGLPEGGGGDDTVCA
jgi:RimJ/RimL family protein N-acetyltransferase